MRESIGQECAGQARRLAERWLEEIGAVRPPVPVHEIAGYLGIRVLRRALAPGMLAERKGLGEQAEVVLNSRWEGVPSLWRVRLRFALAHEIMALRLPRIAVDCGDDTESVYQLCASELLLFRPWLCEAVGELDWDLPRIAALFETSCEATARAMAALDDCLLTIVDNLQQTTRLATGALGLPRSILPCERQALRRAHETWQPQETQDDWARTRAWPIEPHRHVKRIIALTWPHLDAA